MGSATTNNDKPPERPTAISVLPDNIPAVLKERRQWVCWRYEYVDERWTKVPFQTNGEKAKSNNSRTWTSFVDALTAYHAGEFDGIGFCLKKDDPFTIIDLDKARDPQTGELHEWARDLLDDWPSYAEVSPSGTGIRAIGIGPKPGTKCGPKGYGTGRAEMYDKQTKKYLTFTGHRLESANEGIVEAGDNINRIYHAVFAEKKKENKETPQSDPPPQSAGNNLLGDEDIIKKMFAARNKEKAIKLWGGDCSDFRNGDGEPDESRADAALCCIIAFYTDDRAQVERVFSQSGLAKRGKWQERADYRDLTIASALATVTKKWKPKIRGMFGDGSKGKEQTATDTKNGTVYDVNGSEPQPGFKIILAYFRDRYRPLFRRGNSIFCSDGREVAMNEAIAVPSSPLIAKLAGAIDAPRAPQSNGGGVKIDALPGFFSKWAKVAWGDLLLELPEEDDAELGAGAESAADEFRRMVRDALLSFVVLGRNIRGPTEQLSEVERSSVISWCDRFADFGPWRGLRSFKIWFKLKELEGGEGELMIAIRQELFAQLKADRELCRMNANKFTRRCERYGVGKPDDDERPHGQRAVILDRSFVEELRATIPDTPEEATNQEDTELATVPMDRWKDDPGYAAFKG